MVLGSAGDWGKVNSKLKQDINIDKDFLVTAEETKAPASKRSQVTSRHRACCAVPMALRLARGTHSVGGTGPGAPGRRCGSSRSLRCPALQRAGIL